MCDSLCMKKEVPKKAPRGTHSFHLSENVKEALRVVAEKDDRSMSNILEVILKSYFDSKGIKY